MPQAGVTLGDLIQRWAQPGQVAWIGLRPGRREAMQPIGAAEVALDGLVGDRARAGKRAVTLVQSEHLPVIGAVLGQGPVAPEILRRNLVVAGLNLAALRGRSLRLGTAVVEVTTVCAPCSRMEAALGHGGYSAMRAHGGWCARVLEPGFLQIGDAVTPLDP